MTVRSGNGAGVSGQAYLRASTADRERALDVLKAGYAEGRLTKDEYDARAGQAFNARTLGELARITADLPGGQPAAPAWPPARRGTNVLAVASLACGVGQPFTGFLSTIPAIVLGHMARREIRRTGEDGAGLATAGLVLGWSGAILILLALVLFVALVALVARL
jgi:DUF1707 SHOCT-like domain/Domain of unknown function (DUF4190)